MQRPCLTDLEAVPAFDVKRKCEKEVKFLFYPKSIAQLAHLQSLDTDFDKSCDWHITWLKWLNCMMFAVDTSHAGTLLYNRLIVVPHAQRLRSVRRHFDKNHKTCVYLYITFRMKSYQQILTHSMTHTTRWWCDTNKLLPEIKQPRVWLGTEAYSKTMCHTMSSKMLREHICTHMQIIFDHREHKVYNQNKNNRKMNMSTQPLPATSTKIALRHTVNQTSMKVKINK